MIDHINLPVSNLVQATRFYADALAPLGYGVLRETETFSGVGPKEGTNKWIGTLWLGKETIFSKMHVAFRAPTQVAVDRFYEEAIKAGGRGNGAPGIRARYHDRYYAAFILDLDGHNIEVVCHQ